MRHYFSWEEDEANKQGHDDEKHHRSDYTHSKYAYDGEDRAYWDGRDDEAKEMRRQREEREEEERQEREDQERHMRRMEAQREEERQQEEEEYERQRYEDDMRERDMEEQQRNEMPISEEELFNQIEEDERGNQAIKSDSN